MTRRQLFRLIAYALLGVSLILLLVLYALYLSAQKLPKFYSESLAVSEESSVRHSEQMRHKIGQLNNDLQRTEKPWEMNITAEELNGYFAAEMVKGGNIFPPEVRNPRLSFSKQQIDFACRIEQDSVIGILLLSVQLTLPEPNCAVFRVKRAKFGMLPISKKLPARMLAEALEKKGFKTETRLDADEPVISATFHLKYSKKYTVQLDTLSVQDGVVQLSGSSKKEEK